MKVVGLTGGIASGKSTVAKILGAAGIPVIDADVISREIMLPGQPGLAAIARRWPQVIAPDGTLDRPGLAAIVFGDAAARREVSQIAIPEITRVFLARAMALEEKGAAFAVFEAATLFEENMEGAVSGVLCVSLPPEEQVHRVMKRNGLTEAEARARLAAQLPLEEKVRRSRWVLDNTGTEEELKSRVLALWARIERELGSEP